MTRQRMPTSTHRGFGNVPIAAESSVGAPPELLFVHATGFCKELWRPVVHQLTESHQNFEWLAVDQRGHGDSGHGDPPYGWDLLARDVLAVLSEVTDAALVGVGHSSGGAAIARAEILAPGTFRSLVLIEPIIFPPPFERRDTALSRGAERRRSVFRDRQTAHDRFAEGPFGTWTDEALDIYVDHGFRDTAGGWELKCPPDVEADFYQEGYNVDTWDHLPKLAVPVVIVVGAMSESHRGAYLQALCGRFADVELIVIEDAGHLVPMERPHAIGEVVRATI